MILKYELPPLGCAALGAPSLDGGGGSPIEIGYFDIPAVEQFTPPVPALFSSPLVFATLKVELNWLCQTPFPPPRFTFIGKPTTNCVFCYSTSNTSTLEKSHWKKTLLDGRPGSYMRAQTQNNSSWNMELARSFHKNNRINNRIQFKHFCSFSLVTQCNRIACYQIFKWDYFWPLGPEAVRCGVSPVFREQFFASLMIDNFLNLKANLYILTTQKSRKFLNFEQDYAKCKYCRNFIKSLPDDKISSLSKFDVFEYIAWLMGGVKTS